jgi:hypothetical protein
MSSAFKKHKPQKTNKRSLPGSSTFQRISTTNTTAAISPALILLDGCGLCVGGIGFGGVMAPCRQTGVRNADVVVGGFDRLVCL